MSQTTIITSAVPGVNLVASVWQMKLALTIVFALLVGVACTSEEEERQEAIAEEVVANFEASSIGNYEPEVVEGVDDAQLAGATDGSALVGLSGNSVEELEQVVLATYEQSEAGLELAVVADPVFVVEGQGEFTWEVTGLADDSVSGERLTIQVTEAEGTITIQGALVRPICARGVSEEATCL